MQTRTLEFGVAGEIEPVGSIDRACVLQMMGRCSVLCITGNPLWQRHKA